jgi:glutathione S-transferase
MIELITLPPAFGMRNVSPFCLKIEMLLTALELPFKLSCQKDPRKAPKGKLPFIIVDGKRIADSELIVEYLDEITSGRVFAGLDAEQKGRGVALSRLAEDHLYWLMVASRWLDDAWWPNIVDGFFGFVPGLLRNFAAGQARKQVAKTYGLHGLGRHTLEEQKSFARRDLDALRGALPAQGFLFAQKPGVFDFTIAAMLAGIFDNEPATWLTDIAADYEDLRAYTERVQSAIGLWGRK